MPLDPSRDGSVWRFFLATNKKEIPWLALNSLFYGCGTLSMLAATYLFSRIIDLLQNLEHPSLVPYAVGMIFLLLGYEVGFRLGHIVEVRVLSDVRANVKRTLFNHTVSLSFGYFTDRFAGEIAHKIGKSADAMEQIVRVFSNTIFEEGMLFLASAIALCFVNPALGVYVLVWFTVFLAGIVPYARYCDLRANEFALEEAKTTGTFVDLYSNIAAVKVYGHERSKHAAHHQILAERLSFRRLGFWLILIYNYEGLSIVVLGSGLLGITALLHLHGAISIAQIVFVSGVALRVLMNVWEVGNDVSSLIRNHGEVVQNLEDLLHVPEIVDGSHTGLKPSEEVALEYRDVTFGYSNDRPILRNFSINLSEGEKIGIVGLSGAGKTTFANLLLRFFDAQSGKILLNGSDITNFTQEFLRSHISYISQDTSLFHASIAENIAYGAPAASRADIEHAARLAYADEFIEKLPRGYESVVGERGIKLSGGQRQRIAIARAILADRPIFLLDEATSALDSDSEQKIQKGLEKLMEGKTVIAIAHRLSTLSHMDRIIFLENGTIVEDGTHEELLAKGGKYAELWHLQAGGFLPDEMPE